MRGRPMDPTSTNYSTLHKRVANQRGPAKLQQCVRCPAQAAEWAQVHTEDGKDPWADYVSLCRHCHQQYDDHARHKRGRPYTEIFGIRTHDQMSASARRGWAGITAEQRTARANKIWATRRARSRIK